MEACIVSESFGAKTGAWRTGASFWVIGFEGTERFRQLSPVERELQGFSVRSSLGLEVQVRGIQDQGFTA